MCSNKEEENPLLLVLLMKINLSCWINFDF